MKQASMLLPDAALLVVILRAAAIHLYSTRATLFAFLCVWFLFSLSTAVMAQALDTRSPSYAVLYAVMQWAAIASSLPLLATTPTWLTNRWTMIAGIASGLAFAIAGSELKVPFSFFTVGVLGQMLLVSAIVLRPGERFLFACIGVNLITFSLGAAAARKYGQGPAAYEWVAFASTAIWLVLAWNLSPRHDAIINPEKLALTPSARILFGFVREVLRG